MTEPPTRVEPVWWELLNKPFTFILGSVVIALAGYTFTNYRTCRQTQLDDQRRLSEIEYELVSRAFMIRQTHNTTFDQVSSLRDFKGWTVPDFAFEYGRIAHKWNMSPDYILLERSAFKLASEFPLPENSTPGSGLLVWGGSFGSSLPSIRSSCLTRIFE